MRTYRDYLVRRRYAKGTIAARVAAARKWVAEVEWRACDFRVVEAWISEHRITAHSQRNVIGYLRAFYRWAMREGLVDVDPTALVDSPRLPSLLPRPARDEHVAHVVSGAGVELTAIIGLMAGGGLRCCEVAALRWSDVDLADGWVHVMGKGSRERRVHLGAEVVALVAALDGTDGPVFPGYDGGHRSSARVSQMVCKAFRGGVSDDGAPAPPPRCYGRVGGAGRRHPGGARHARSLVGVDDAGVYRGGSGTGGGGVEGGSDAGFAS